MKNFKLTRNLWIIAGFCFLLSFIINLSTSKSASLPILNVITAAIMFINAFTNHKKINRHR